MPISDQEKEELLKPFREKLDLADAFIEEAREKLGTDNATLINDSLIGLRGAITETSDLIENSVVDTFETKERNKKLADVNNDLYIRNSAALKNTVEKKEEVLFEDGDDAIDAFAEALLPEPK